RLLHIVKRVGQTVSDSGIWKHQKRNREVIFLHVISYPIVWEDKMCRMVVAQDVSARYKTGGALRESRVQFQKIMDQAPAIICTINRQGTIIYANTAAKCIWGYNSRHLFHKNFFHLIRPEDMGATCQAIEEAIKNKGVAD